MARPEPPRGRDELPPLADDGLPTLSTGEPVLARWFVLAMLVLVPAAIAVTVWSLASIPEGDIAPAERRPPGTAQRTYDRGEAAHGEASRREAGPACAQRVDVVGDADEVAAGHRVLRATCDALGIAGMDRARDGLRELAGGSLRFAAFERSGVESTTRVEDGVAVLELNAKFRVAGDPERAAPVVVHELTLLGSDDFPGRPVGAREVVAATEAQLEVCEARGLLDAEPPPRGCLDARGLLAEDDPVAALVDAGFRDDREGARG